MKNVSKPLFKLRMNCRGKTSTNLIESNRGLLSSFVYISTKVLPLNVQFKNFINKLWIAGCQVWRLPICFTAICIIGIEHREHKCTSDQISNANITVVVFCLAITFLCFFFFRKDLILQLWEQLLELLKRRRSRLEKSMKLQRCFQEMINTIDWMDEIKVFEHSSHWAWINCFFFLWK